MMSFLTPPPEFEECGDSTTMFKNTACLPDIFYPSPSTSSSAGCHQSSYSSHSSPSSQNDHYLDQVEDHQPMFENPASLSYDSAASSQSYGMDVPFNMYEQPSWSSYQSMQSQYPPLHASHEDGSFFAYPEGALPANMIPATPQPATHFNFNAPVRVGDSSHYLMGRQAFTPEPSTTSLSRSCSPNPSHISATNHHLHARRSRHSSVASASSPLHHYGIPVLASGASPNSAPQAWRCAYPNCTSRATFIRGCDLRKHYNRHSKHLFCRVDGCPQSETAALAAAQQADPHCKDPSQLVLSGGFSSKKDRARHEAKHNPGIKCEWVGAEGEGCGRVFSRMDNMKDHVRRIHQKGPAKNESAIERADRLRKSRR